MGLQKIAKIKDVLLEVLPDVYHYTAKTPGRRYAVWMELGEKSQSDGDNCKIEQAIYGTIDFYTEDEDDTKQDEIQEALKREGISFFLASVQYEEKTGLIHYEWEWVI